MIRNTNTPVWFKVTPSLINQRYLVEQIACPNSCHKVDIINEMIQNIVACIERDSPGISIVKGEDPWGNAFVLPEK
jgi:hypothetical protein